MRTRRIIWPAVAIAMALAGVFSSPQPAKAMTAGQAEARAKVLRTQVSRLSHQIHEAGEQLRAAEKAVARHRKALASSQERMTELREVMSQRAAQLYMLGSEAAYADLSSVTVLADRLTYLEALHTGERGLLEELRALRSRSEMESQGLSRALDKARAAHASLRARRASLSGSLNEMTRLASFLRSVGPRVHIRASRTGGGIVCPILGPNVVSNNWGAPRPGGPHTGVDISANTGQAVRAVLAGTIVDTPSGGWVGIGVVLRDLAGNEWWYAHLSSRAVSRGQRVGAGQILGRVGCTGRCYGSHLHFEYHPGGGGPSNPYAIVSQAC